MGNFLIPANSKKSMLIFGLFNEFDLILFGCGIGITFILVFILPLDKLIGVVGALAPACITGFLVMPVPNYHNIRTLIGSIYQFYTGRRNYVWKGWCVASGEKDGK